MGVGECLREWVLRITIKIVTEYRHLVLDGEPRAQLIDIRDY